MTRVFAAALLLLPAAASAQKPSVLPSIYGADDRKDLYEAAPWHRELAGSVAVLVPKAGLTEVGKSGTWFLQSKPYETASGGKLCPGVRFRGQPTAADCSASLVAPNLALTAYHCVRGGESDTHKLAFGYGMTVPNKWPTNFASADLHDFTVLDHGYDREGGVDWALLSLDRPSGRTPLKIDESGSVAVGNKIMTIGSPAGLPLKVSAGATVRSVSGAEFKSDLDILGGNSGGPVIDEATSRVVGILIQGDASYADDRGNDCVKPFVLGEEDMAKNRGNWTRATRVLGVPAYRAAVDARAKNGEDAAKRAAEAKAGAEKAGEKTRNAIRATGWIPADEWPKR